MTTETPVAGRVYGSDGQLGTVLPAGQDLGQRPDQTVIALMDGRRVFIPTAMLARRTDGDYELPYSLAELTQADLDRDGQRVVIPIIAEELEVGKRVVETGRVRVRKLVQEHTEQVDEPLFREEVHVERVSLNQQVDQAPLARHEGDVLIVPIVEEILVVEKRLMLREEVRISKRRTTTSEQQQVVLRREELVVERLAPGDDTASGSQAS